MCGHLVLIFFIMVLLAGAKIHLVLILFGMVLLAGAKFVVIWCVLVVNCAPSWCKICVHLVLIFVFKIVLLAGAKCVLI